MDPTADPRWVPENEYEFICERVPIVCVDVLPLIDGTNEFGLIERDTPSGARGLNLIGGGVLIDESFAEALQRHVEWTLGKAAHLDVESLRFVGVYPYYKTPRAGELHDPRKHAVSLTYTGIVSGEFVPDGSVDGRKVVEAHDFRRFDLGAPPPPGAFGWAQGPVVYEALATVVGPRG